MTCRPNIFFYCHSHNRPSGGQLDTYRHVDALASLGYNACVVHEAADYRLTWFENQTPILGHGEFNRRVNHDTDVVVLPEDLGCRILSYPGRKIIFNKGLINGCTALGDHAPQHDPYLAHDVIGVFTVSDHDQQILSFAYPSQFVYKVLPSIDLDQFAFRPLTAKRSLILTVRKGWSSVLTLFHLLQARSAQNMNTFSQYEWRLLDSCTQRTVSELMGQALLFIFLSEDEGLGRAPIEAMAAGCLVASFGGGPMQELLPLEYRFVHGDFKGLAEYVENILSTRDLLRKKWVALTTTARDQVEQMYSASTYRRAIQTTWTQVCKTL